MRASTKESGDAYDAAVAAEIRAERAKRDIPVKVLAERAGIPSRTLTRYLSGERSLTLPLLLKIATALGVEPDVLLRSAAQERQERQGEV